ncbi:MAG: IS66 family transposase [Legionellaceae bacterium]|nr:IS66 family transposase [Legionellaceae bacterium]
MKADKINITETVESARKLLEADKKISPALRAMFEMLLMIITLLAGKLGLNSQNSSKPPSTDPNRKKKTGSNKGNNKPGGQPGRVGKNLEPVDNPDTIIPIKLDKRRLPKGNYTEVGFESRQVIDIEISRIVTEYRAQILEDAAGKRYVAAFPKGVSRPIQYGQSIKAHAVYLSQFQLIPYERVADYFINEASIPISVGSLFNFNQEAYDLLEGFDAIAKQKLIEAALVHADETGINVNGKRIWLHNASNERWTYFYPHQKRGCDAMDEIGILPHFRGTLIHDHWKPYYTYQHCQHGLCNAHHIRELQWVIDNHAQHTWAKSIQDLLLEINETVNKTEKNCLDNATADAYRMRFRQIIQTGEAEMPLPPPEPNQSKKRGREKKPKERNLLERLRDFENDVLRFMVETDVPFTNNRGENDIRMTKVQQKISGCFKSMDGAKIFCRVRSYLLTAQKHGVTPTDALKTLFDGKLPAVFFTEK